MMYDVFFLSYNEPMAQQHWKKLVRHAPHSSHVSGITGIHNAHYECAKLSKTRNFFVIDADSEIIDFDFTIKLSAWDRKYVHLWYARNPVNGLEYGWGGIKLFPKEIVLNMSDQPLDMTTSFELKIIPEVKSITHYNSSDFDCWRAAFRECVKLAVSDDYENANRLEQWKHPGTGYGANMVVKGAVAGEQYGLRNKHNITALKKINDFAWLKLKFEDIK